MSSITSDKSISMELIYWTFVLGISACILAFFSCILYCVVIAVWDHYRYFEYLRDLRHLKRQLRMSKLKSEAYAQS